MKTLFLIHDEGFEPEVTSLIERDMVVTRYSRIDDVVGARVAELEAETGYTMKRRNRLIIVIAEDELISRLAGELAALRRRKGHGLRGFVVPVEVVI
jgi:hypothetical protein